MNKIKKVILCVLCLFVNIGLLPETALAEGVGDDKQEVLSSNLFHNSTYYNNDLALACALLCCDVDDVSAYFPDEHNEHRSAQYTWELDSNVFHIGIGYKTIDIDGEARNLISITCRGTESFYEGTIDVLKDINHGSVKGHTAYGGAFQYHSAAQNALNDFISKHPSVLDYPLLYLVTGHSLGGAAANLLGAELNDYGADNVFVYTFGAIKALTEAENVESNYSNIHNIYNYYDLFGPNGYLAALDVSDPYHKFGHTYLFYAEVGADTHDMANTYMGTVRNDGVINDTGRRAGTYGNKQWWTLNNHILTLCGSGSLATPWSKYSDEITEIVIKSGATQIGDFFYIYPGLVTVRIPASVTRIGHNGILSFELKDIFYDGTPDQWEAVDIDQDTMDEFRHATLHFKADDSSVSDDPPSIAPEIPVTPAFMPTVAYTAGGVIVSWSEVEDAKYYTMRIQDSETADDRMIGDTVFAQSTFYEINLGTTIRDQLEHAIEPGSYSFYIGATLKNGDWITSEPIPFTVYVSLGAWGSNNNLMYTLDKDGVLTISGTGDMPDDYRIILSSVQSIIVEDGITSVKNLDHMESLTSVSLSNSVTSIGDAAFRGCSNLISIDLPNNLKQIGKYAFFDCSSLSSITVPSSVESIGTYAFQNCSSLKSITIPNSVSKIETYTFCNCTNLASVAIGSGVKSVAKKAFSGCSSLKGVYISDITAWCSIDFSDYPLNYAHNLYLNNELVEELLIPEGVNGIGRYSFCGCTSLKSIVLPDTVSSIGAYAFYNCRNLASFTIPDSVTSIESYTFYNCYGLESIVVPNCVESIGYRAFYGCSHLASATIGDRVTRIGEQAFYGCARLTIMALPDSVVDVGANAFYNCTGLVDFEMSNSVKSIEPRTFYNCSSLTEITIPFGVTSIGTYAFSDCSSLTNVWIPDTVNSIGSYAFNNCASLVGITIPDGVNSIENNTFNNCDALVSITLGDGVTNIGSYAFNNCNNLAGITIPDSVVSIGSCAFYSCDNLADVEMGKGVTSIGERAFRECSSLTSIIIPDGVTAIEFGTFRDCVCLSIISIGEKVASIEDAAFYNCASLINIDIPDGVSRIGEGAFRNCASLVTLTIPESVAIIEHSAFRDCSRLESIVISDCVTDIGELAFYGSGLKTVKIPMHLESLAQGVFWNCNSLQTVVIPKSIVAIGDSAFQACPLTDVYYEGSESDWASITIGDINHKLAQAAIHYNYTPTRPTSIETVDVNDGIINVSVQASEATIVWCAMYDANGRFISVQQRSIVAGENTLSCYLADGAAIIKVFALNAEQKPICKAKAIFFNVDVEGGNWYSKD